MKNNKLNICVMFGGTSVEHDISIISGIQVYNALDKDKYNVFVIYVSKDNHMYMGPNLHLLNTYKSYIENSKVVEVSIIHDNDYAYILKKKKKQIIDCFIPVFHGQGVEDGTISALLNFHNATYITSDITSSALSQDKIFTKDILRRYNISTIRYMRVDKTNFDNLDINGIKLKYPLIIKPSRLGSSIGIKTVNKKEELKEAIESCFKYDTKVIIEEKLTNINEYNCAVFRYKNNLYPSLIEEVKTTNNFLTFEDKYLDGAKTNQDTRTIPAVVDIDLEEKIKKLSNLIYQIFDYKGVIRIDYIYDLDNKRLYFNEVNTIPGSFAFYLYDKKGISFTKMLDMLIKDSIISKNKDKLLIKSFETNVLNKKTLRLKK